MGKIYVFLFLLLINNNCFSAAKITYSYDHQKRKIYANSPTGNAHISFHERNEGNSLFYFDFFDNNPAIVHESVSLNLYSSYATLNFRIPSFYLDCVYLELKSGQNGLYTKEGRCGINEIIPEDIDYLEKKLDRVASKMIDEKDGITTLNFLNGELKYLPVLVFRNKKQFIYKVYNTKDDLIEGRHTIYSCNIQSNKCDIYDQHPWVVVNNQNTTVEFKVSKIANETKFLEIARPIKTISIGSLIFPPFMVSADKGYFYDDTFHRLKSYLIKNDKITLLSIDDDKKWCAVRYLNEGNKRIDGNMQCADLSL